MVPNCGIGNSYHLDHTNRTLLHGYKKSYSLNPVIFSLYLTLHINTQAHTLPNTVQFEAIWENR